MKLLTANTGSYPKIGSSPDKQKYREAYAKWERGEISREEFERIQDEVVKEVIEEQCKAGLDIVTDGQIRWIDPISHFTLHLTGCELDGLLRYFDTNFYFRQPVIKEKPAILHTITKREYLFAKRVSPVTVKQVITGPYTLAKLCINKSGSDFPTLVKWFTEVVANEVHDLSRLGRCYIQIDEPAILRHPDDFGLLEEAMHEICSEKKRSKIYLYTYFGDASPLFKKFEKLPVDGIGFDLIYGPRVIRCLEKERFKKEAIGLGLIDGRNTKLETARDVLRVMSRILRKLEVDTAFLNPSCGLEFLPREVAFKKLSNMVKISKVIKMKLL